MPSSLAAVLTGPHQLELRDFPLPELTDDSGLLRVERNGLCGTDVEQLHGDLAGDYDVIPGHEPLGVIEQIGDTAAARWKVTPGDRVVVESAMPCRHCPFCAAGDLNLCPNKLTLGATPITASPSLYGGYSQHLYLHPNATPHRISPDVPSDIASYFNALSGGVDWVGDASDDLLGADVVVLGSGQRGLACALVARAMGAQRVVITGLTRDAPKLERARRLGVDHTIDIERESLTERVSEITHGDGADIVIDTVPIAASTINDAVAIARTRATIVIAGIKGERAVPNFMSDEIVRRALTLKGVSGKRSRSYDVAIEMIENQRFAFEELRAVAYPLAQARDAVEHLAGNGPADGATCVSIDPWA